MFSVDDIERAIVYLQAAGVGYGPVRFSRYTLSRLIFFNVPDGLPLKLLRHEYPIAV